MSPTVVMSLAFSNVTFTAGFGAMRNPMGGCFCTLPVRPDLLESTELHNFHFNCVNPKDSIECSELHAHSFVPVAVARWMFYSIPYPGNGQLPKVRVEVECCSFTVWYRSTTATSILRVGDYFVDAGVLTLINPDCQ